jgi:hypothetical protein
LDHHEIAPFGKASTSQLIPSTPAEVNADFAQSAADLLRASLALAEESSPLHNAVTAALAYHLALIDDHHKKLEVSDNYSRVETRVANALLRRFKKPIISDDDDDINDTPEEAARHNLIRRRKTRRLIERRKQDSEAKDSFAAPSDPLPLNRRFSNHHYFLAAQIFFMDSEDMAVHKDWGSPVEMWVFKQFEKGPTSHTAFHVYLKSDHGLQLNRVVKRYFCDFAHFKEVILGLFFTKLRDPIAVIEKNLIRIKLTLTGADGPFTPTTLEGFCNTLRFLFNQAPAEGAYPERQQVSRIRERLPKQVETDLLE